MQNKLIAYLITLILSLSGVFYAYTQYVQMNNKINTQAQAVKDLKNEKQQLQKAKEEAESNLQILQDISARAAKIAKELDDENKRIKNQAIKRSVDLKKQLIEVDESKVSEEEKDSLRSEKIFESLLQAHAQALSE